MRIVTRGVANFGRRHDGLGVSIFFRAIGVELFSEFLVLREVLRAQGVGEFVVFTEPAAEIDEFAAGGAEWAGGFGEEIGLLAADRALAGAVLR
jgi:hypothetical protein